MKKIGVKKITVTKIALNRKITPGGPVSDCGNYCSGDDYCPAVCGDDGGCPSVCWNDDGCGGFCKSLSPGLGKGGLVSNPARKLNVARVQRKMR